MKNNILSVFFLSFFFIASANINALAQNMVDSSYFPLNLGNEWSYTIRENPHTEKIIDTSTINGKLYYGLSTFPDIVDFWLRASNDSVFTAYGDSTEYLLYHFGGNIGDTIQLSHFGCSFGNNVILMGKQDTVTTPAGIFTNCIHFKHIAYCMDAGMIESWFAKGVGKIRYSDMSIGGSRIHTLSSYNLVIDSSHTNVKSHINIPTLLRSYPNPFNTYTNLIYHVQKEGQVTLTIVDLMGRHIACLESDRKPVGDYQVCWNASGLSNGVYLAVIRMNGLFEIKKLILQQ